MYDTNLLFFNNIALTTTTNAVLNHKKTPAAGIWAEIALKNLVGSASGGTIDAVIAESDDNSVYNNLVTFPQVLAGTGNGRWNRLVQSQKAYLKLTVTLGTGTGLAGSLTAGLVTGPVQDEVV